MNRLHFQIITPERTVYSDEVDSVSAPMEWGQITILPHHIPLVASLVPGELIVRKDEEERNIAVSGGLIEVRSDSRVVALADTAEHAAEIDELRAIEAKSRAEKLLKEKRSDATDYAMLTAKLQKELARIRVVRRRNKTKIQ